MTSSRGRSVQRRQQAGIPTTGPPVTRGGTVAAKATYLYCVIQARRPRVARAALGLPGLGRPRLLDAGGSLWLVVGDAPLPRYGEASIARGLRDLAWVSQCAVAHEAVVESWLGARGVVPMKLFTIFESDDRALAYINGERARLDRAIQRVAGNREWGVRIRRTVAPNSRRLAPRAASGAGYLAQKKRALDAVRDQAVLGQALADAAFAALAERAVEAERHPPPGGDIKSSLLLDAAFLVRTGCTAQFQAKARLLARDLKSQGYDIELTGPWPPYNFIEPK